MKGITPVIAMILLVLIVVALGGVFAAWTSRIATTTTEAGEEQIETITGQLQKSIAIDALDCVNGRVYVRNTGTPSIPLAEIAVYRNNTAVDVTCSLCPLVAGNVTTLTSTAGAFSSGDTIKVVVAGNSVSDDC